MSGAGLAFLYKEAGGIKCYGKKWYLPEWFGYLPCLLKRVHIRKLCTPCLFILTEFGKEAGSEWFSLCSKFYGAGCLRIGCQICPCDSGGKPDSPRPPLPYPFTDQFIDKKGGKEEIIRVPESFFTFLFRKRWHKARSSTIMTLFIGGEITNVVCWIRWLTETSVSYPFLIDGRFLDESRI